MLAGSCEQATAHLWTVETWLGFWLSTRRSRPSPGRRPRCTHRVDTPTVLSEIDLVPAEHTAQITGEPFAHVRNVIFTGMLAVATGLAGMSPPP
jgi:hypothetical protein